MKKQKFLSTKILPLVVHLFSSVQFYYPFRLLKAGKKVWQTFRLGFLFRSAITQVHLFLRNLPFLKARLFCSGCPIFSVLYSEFLCFCDLITLIVKLPYYCTNQLNLRHLLKKLYSVINFL